MRVARREVSFSSRRPLELGRKGARLAGAPPRLSQLPGHASRAGPFRAEDRGARCRRRNGAGRARATGARTRRPASHVRRARQRHGHVELRRSGLVPMDRAFGERARHQAVCHAEARLEDQGGVVRVDPAEDERFAGHGIGVATAIRLDAEVRRKRSGRSALGLPVDSIS